MTRSSANAPPDTRDRAWPVPGSHTKRTASIIPLDCPPDLGAAAIVLRALEAPASEPSGADPLRSWRALRLYAPPATMVPVSTGGSSGRRRWYRACAVAE
jgi:hypothetical protein